MHRETEQHGAWNLAGPTHNELFRARVQVTIVEGGRVDRVEQPLEFCNSHFDDLRNSAASGAGRNLLEKQRATRHGR